jgi:hypothetical protein
MYKGIPLNKISDEIVEFNIGTKDSPKLIKFGKGTTTDEREKLIALIREFKYLSSWSYEDLKAYREYVIQHTIPLIDGTNPFRQKLRQMNPKVSPQVQKELQKMVEARIIEPIRYSSWVSNPVIVRKKTDKIRICVDFINLNQASLKDNYPLPNMEYLLKRVTSAEMMSMLDGFSRYNQVLVNKDDQLKIVFTTPWGTYKYLRMPFGLTNAGDTFQHAMDYAFRDIIQKIIEIYQDDLTAISKKREQHVQHLRTIFQRCREYDISLNPKKSIFGVDKGKLLGHIISKYGIMIDPTRVEDIKRIPLPKDNKSLQSFFGQINFIRRFVPNFAEIVKPLNKLLNKDAHFEWESEGEFHFNASKRQ